MNPDLQSYIDDILVAPRAGRAFLLKEILTAYLQNCIVLYSFIRLLLIGRDEVFECAPVTSIWLLSLFLANLISFYCKVVCIPRVFGILINKDTAIIIRQLMTSLEYIRNLKISTTIVMTYLFGLILLIVDASQEFLGYYSCMNDTQLRYFMRLIYISFSVKLWLSKVNDNQRQNEKMEESLRTFILNIPFKQQEYQQLCSICLVEFQNSEMVSQIRCKHIFHQSCIQNWLKMINSNKSCPVCRELLQQLIQ